MCFFNVKNTSFHRGSILLFELRSPVSVRFIIFLLQGNKTVHFYQIVASTKVHMDIKLHLRIR